MATQYKVIALDVWGNARDGFDVNAWHPTDIVLALSDDKPVSDRQIVAALKSEGLIRRNVRYSSIAVAHFDDTLTVECARTAEPLYNLELIR